MLTPYKGDAENGGDKGKGGKDGKGGKSSKKKKRILGSSSERSEEDFYVLEK